MKFAESSKFLKVTILYSCDENEGILISQYAIMSAQTFLHQFQNL